MKISANRSNPDGGMSNVTVILHVKYPCYLNIHNYCNCLLSNRAEINLYYLPKTHARETLQRQLYKRIPLYGHHREYTPSNLHLLCCHVLPDILTAVEEEVL